MPSSLVCPLQAPSSVAPSSVAPSSVARGPALATAADPLIVLAVLVALAFGLLATVVKFAMIQSTAPSAEPPVEKTNCPACGARTPVEDPSCDYCGESLHGDGTREETTAATGEPRTDVERT